MARKVEYLCDDCGKLFGSNPHINIKNGDIRISYINEFLPGGGRWLQKKFALPCQEYHFCDGVCLGRFFMRLYDIMKQRVTATEGKDDNTQQPSKGHCSL